METGTGEKRWRHWAAELRGDDGEGRCTRRCIWRASVQWRHRIVSFLAYPVPFLCPVTRKYRDFRSWPNVDFSQWQWNTLDKFETARAKRNGSGEVHDSDLGHIAHLARFQWFFVVANQGLYFPTVLDNCVSVSWTSETDSPKFVKIARLCKFLTDTFAKVVCGWVSQLTVTYMCVNVKKYVYYRYNYQTLRRFLLSRYSSVWTVSEHRCLCRYSLFNSDDSD